MAAGARRATDPAPAPDQKQTSSSGVKTSRPGSFGVNTLAAASFAASGWADNWSAKGLTLFQPALTRKQRRAHLGSSLC